MDLILQKFAGKIDAQSLIKTVEELKSEYIDDGLTKEDVPPILGRLMMESQKFKKLPGPQKKKSAPYTHLPAHETVLDLVCRLLLEKKKNTHLRPHFTHSTFLSPPLLYTTTILHHLQTLSHPHSPH